MNKSAILFAIGNQYDFFEKAGVFLCFIISYCQFEISLDYFKLAVTYNDFVKEFGVSTIVPHQPNL